MKKISKNSGAVKKRTDYFEIVRSTPEHLRKRGTRDDLVQKIEEARTEKLRKAS